MTLPELINAVEKRTRRPDLQDEILLAIQEATLFIHNIDFFQRDFVEVPFLYNVAIFRGQFIISDSFPGFRKIGYIRKYDPVGKIMGDFLLPVAPDKQFDYYQNKKTNVFYSAGKVVNWISSTGDISHIVAYWKYPRVNRENYESWIAELHPFAIVNKSCAILFRQIGQQDESNASERSFAENRMLIEINEVESSGR